MTSLDALQLTGRSDRHVVALPGGCRVHRGLLEPLRRLQAAAAGDGIELVPCSGFRDFDAQLDIWNSKFRGERPLYDRAGRELDHAALDELELIDAILAWSALPGASRHHWGSDIDVIDRAAQPPEYRPRLLPAEYAPGGVYERLGRWLDERLGEFGFFRPYRTARGGVNPEPWHLSYAPIAGPALRALDVGLLREVIDDPRLLGRERLRAELERLHERYIRNIDPP